MKYCLISSIYIVRLYIYIYMVRFKARQHFKVPHGKIDFFAEAGRKKVCSFTSKEKMFLSVQGTKYLEIHWFPYNS